MKMKLLVPLIFFIIQLNAQNSTDNNIDYSGIWTKKVEIFKKTDLYDFKKESVIALRENILIGQDDMIYFLTPRFYFKIGKLFEQSNKNARLYLAVDNEGTNALIRFIYEDKKLKWIRVEYFETHYLYYITRRGNWD